MDFYKRHRAILESDLIHLRRADGRDLDTMLHVNPRLEERGLLMVYNPLDRTVSRTLRIPLYYTGLTEAARISEREGRPRTYRLNRRCEVQLDVRVPPFGVTWYLISAPTTSSD